MVAVTCDERLRDAAPALLDALRGAVFLLESYEDRDTAIYRACIDAIERATNQRYPAPTGVAMPAHNPTEDQSVDRSYRRLCEFRKSWHPDDTIDDESGLTVDDLDVILAHLAGTLS